MEWPQGSLCLIARISHKRPSGPLATDIEDSTPVLSRPRFLSSVPSSLTSSSQASLVLMAMRALLPCCPVRSSAVRRATRAGRPLRVRASVEGETGSDSAGTQGQSSSLKKTLNSLEALFPTPPPVVVESSPPTPPPVRTTQFYSYFLLSQFIFLCDHNNRDLRSRLIQTCGKK